VIAMPQFFLHASFDDKILDAYVKLSADRNRGGPWSGRWDAVEAYPRWKFAPQGNVPALLAAAWMKDRLVGVTSLRPMPARWGSLPVQAGEIGDLYVDAAARGQGIFSRLLKLIREGAEAHGYSFAFCAPNRQGFARLIASGHFRESPRAERILCLLPLRPSQFTPDMFRGAAQWLADPLARAWLPRMPEGTKGWTRWEDHAGPLPDYLAATHTFHVDKGDLEGRLRRHPDHSEYRLLEAAGGWCIGKGAGHQGRAITFLGSVQGRDPATRKAVLNAAIGACRDKGAAAVALWAARGALSESLGPRRPFLPLARKRIAVLTTPLGIEVLEKNGPISIELLDTDKI
jgi:GNAT superfamily N-acetyltransferase